MRFTQPAIFGNLRRRPFSTASRLTTRAVGNVLSAYGVDKHAMRLPTGANLALKALGGVGRAVAWMLRGSTHRPAVSSQTIQAAAQIVQGMGIQPPPLPPRAYAPVGPVPLPGGISPAPGRIGGGGAGVGSGGRGGLGGNRGGSGGGVGSPPVPPSAPPPSGGITPPPAPGEDQGGGRVNMIRVHGSSNVYAYGYDAFAVALYVQYLAPRLNEGKIKTVKMTGAEQRHKGKKGAHAGKTNSPGPLYAYDGVPERVFLRMVAAVSKGVFVWDELRVRGSIWKHQYPYRLVQSSIGFFDASATRGIIYVPRRATKGGFRTRSMVDSTGMRTQSLLRGTSRNRSIVRQR